MVDERENFSAQTKHVIAARAGFRCSFPSCRKGTIGPGAEPGQTASIGVACHIFSAAAEGPRGHGGLTSEQLKAPTNGFWACEDHAKLVDTNAGTRYPAGLLLGWRELHEARIHREMGGVHLPVKWIESIEVRQSPMLTRDRGRMFKPSQRLNLSKVTLLIGNNGIGKSALCDWMGASAEEDSLWRWAGADLDFALTIYSPERHDLEVTSANGGFSFHFDGVTVPFNPLPVVVQTLPWPARRPEGLSDVDWAAGWLGTTPQVIRRLAEAVGRTGNAFVENITVADDGRIVTKLHVEKSSFSAKQLGGGSTVLLGLALAMARAGNTGLHAPTLLVLDNALTALDSKNKEFVLAEVGRQDRFQTLATLPGEDRSLSWGGWSVAHIRQGHEGSVIEGS